MRRGTQMNADETQMSADDAMQGFVARFARRANALMGGSAAFVRAPEIFVRNEHDA